MDVTREMGEVSRGNTVRMYVIRDGIIDEEVQSKARIARQTILKVSHRNCAVGGGNGLLLVESGGPWEGRVNFFGFGGAKECHVGRLLVS
jgi:hypothetical protein